jgi:hypothetical protein
MKPITPRRRSTDRPVQLGRALEGEPFAGEQMLIEALASVEPDRFREIVARATTLMGIRLDLEILEAGGDPGIFD